MTEFNDAPIDGGQDTGATAGGEGSIGTENFIPEEFAANAHFEGINNFGDIANKFDQMTNDFNQMKGRKGLPTEHTAEEWGQVLTGLPEEAIAAIKSNELLQSQAPEAYEFSDIEGFETTEQDTKMFTDIFKKNNLSQDQANQLRQDIIAGQAEVLKAREIEMDKEFDKMAKETWGADADRKVAELGSKVVKMFEGSGVDAEYLDALIDNKALMPLLKGIDGLLQQSGPDNSAMGSKSTSPGYSGEQAAKMYQDLLEKSMQGDAQATAKIQELDQNPDFLAKVNQYWKG